MGRNGRKVKKGNGLIQMTVDPELETKIRDQAAATFRSTAQYLKDLAVADLVRVGVLKDKNLPAPGLAGKAV
jgi:hypothetical protein